MPVAPNYQAITARNPYAEEANRQGPDRGLWSVLGRAIRSTVPERANPGYNKDMPVGDNNLPYQKPGFFRALAGDRGADFNRAARLNQLDLDTSDDLAGLQAEAFKQSVGVETDAARQLAQQNWLQQQAQAWFENNRKIDLLKRQIKANMSLNAADNAARLRAAEIMAAPRNSAAQDRYMDAKAEAQNIANRRAETRLNRPPVSPNQATRPLGWVKPIWDAVVGTGGPVTPTPAPAPTMPGDVQIAPEDWKALEGRIRC